MKTKFSKLFVTILIVAAVTCCGALGVFAADDTADTAAATTAYKGINKGNQYGFPVIYVQDFFGTRFEFTS